MNDYSLFGWRVRSTLQLAELRPWQGDDRQPDLSFEVAAVPPVDPDLPSPMPGVQHSPKAVRIAIPDVATYWIENGRRVVVDPLMSSDPALVRVFLLGTVLAIVCFQRGLVPLHASAIDIGGRALLISGASGAGKSTLAAAFSERGYRLLSDDLCAVAFGAGQPLRILSAFPRVRLSEESARQLALPTATLARSQEGLEKYNLPLRDTQFQPAPLPPARIVFLKIGRGAEPPAACPLTGVAAMRRYDLVHRWQLGAALGYQPLIFQAMAQLANSVPMVEVTRGTVLTDLPALVDRIRALADAPVSDCFADSNG